MAEVLGLIIFFAVGMSAYFIHDKIDNPGLAAKLIIGGGSVLAIIALFHLIVAPLQ